jgi:hypothetical protein
MIRIGVGGVIAHRNMWIRVARSTRREQKMPWAQPEISHANIVWGGHCSSPQPLDFTATADRGSRWTAWMTKWTKSSSACQWR